MLGHVWGASYLMRTGKEFYLGMELELLRGREPFLPLPAQGKHPSLSPTGILLYHFLCIPYEYLGSALQLSCRSTW